MKIRFKPLNSRGVGHHALIAIVIVIAFASFGAYRVFTSSAKTADGNSQLTQQQKKQLQQEREQAESAKEHQKAQNEKKNSNQKKDDNKNQGGGGNGNGNGGNGGGNGGNGGGNGGNGGGQSQQQREAQERQRIEEQRRQAEADRRRADEQRRQQEEKRKKDEEDRKKNGNNGGNSGGNGSQNNGGNQKKDDNKNQGGGGNGNGNGGNGGGNGGNGGQNNGGQANSSGSSSPVRSTGGPKCAPGFELSSDGKTCVCPSGQERIGQQCQTISGTPEQIKAQCRAANKGYDVATNSCKQECNKGYELKGNTCVVKLSDDQIKAQCLAQFLGYDAKTKSCKDECKAGYKKNKTGTCVEEKSPQEVKAACDARYLKFDPIANKCGDCKANFSPTGNICKPNENVSVVKATCDAEGKKYDKETNTCKQECKTGYVGAVADNFQEGTSTTTCTLRSSSTEDQIKAQCAASFKKWDAVNKSCTDVCKKGFTALEDGSCKVDEQYAQLKGACDNQFKVFDNTTKTCKEDTCKMGYLMNEAGLCVMNEEYEGRMSAQRCAALGRVWAYSDTNDDTSGYCTSQCAETLGQYAVQGSPDTSYCVGTNPMLSVTEGMTAKDCNEANRVFIYLSQVCAPKCKAGFTPALETLPTQALDNTSNVDPLGCVQATPGENGGEGTEEGGCSDGAEVNEETGLCPGDTEVGQDEPAETTLDTEIDKDTCTLLGREWESGAESANGDKISGCKVDECNDEAANLVANQSGVVFCEGHITKIDKDECSEADRVWVKEARGCAANPEFEELEEGDRAPGKKYCASSNRSYVAQEGTDVCMSQTRVERLKELAKLSGVPFGQLLKAGRAGVCNINPSKHWNGEKCIKDKNGINATSEDPLIAVDMFGNTSDVNSEGADIISLSCEEMQALAVQQGRDGSFNCLDSDACEAAGGNAQTGSLLVGNDRHYGPICWTDESDSVSTRIAFAGIGFDTRQTEITMNADCSEMKERGVKNIGETFSCVSESECKDLKGTFTDAYIYVGKNQALQGQVCYQG